MRGRVVRLGMVLALAVGLAAPAGAQPAEAQPAEAQPAGAAAPPLRLRIVGGLGSLNQYTRHEAPFWTQRLSQLSGGRFVADIVPFDRAGIRGQELLSMVRLGTVPFGTLLLSQAAPKDAELGAPDLAGLNPDADALRRSVAAFRPRLAALLRERHGAELLAVYAYPAQVLFCRQPLAGLGGLRGRTVRIASPTQADWVEALGGRAVRTEFNEIVANVRAGNVDCAITGTMSGNTIGLHEATTHIHTMAVTWGLSVFVAHGATWRALPEALRQLLLRELPKVEQAVWDEAVRETEAGVLCNIGDRRCTGGRPGQMQAVRPSAADEVIRRSILTGTTLPRWLQRCGPGCAASWNQHLAEATGVRATAD